MKDRPTWFRDRCPELLEQIKDSNQYPPHEPISPEFWKELREVVALGCEVHCDLLEGPLPENNPGKDWDFARRCLKKLSQAETSRRNPPANTLE